MMFISANCVYEKKKMAAVPRVEKECLDTIVFAIILVTSGGARPDGRAWHS